MHSEDGQPDEPRGVEGAEREHHLGTVTSGPIAADPRGGEQRDDLEEVHQRDPEEHGVDEPRPGGQQRQVMVNVPEDDEQGPGDDEVEEGDEQEGHQHRAGTCPSTR